MLEPNRGDVKFWNNKISLKMTKESILPMHIIQDVNPNNLYRSG